MKQTIGHGGPSEARLRSVKGRVLDELRAALLAGEFEAGAHLPEADLAERLGVSRAPVREAFRHLADEGLISLETGRGATVLGVRDDEVDGNYRVSAVVEEEIFAHAAERVTEADLKGLERIVEDLEHVVRMRDVVQAAEADILFHATVAEISGLGLLKHLLAYMHRVSRFRTRQKLRRPDMRWDHWFAHMTDSHRDLIEVLRTGDPGAAAEAVHEHLYALKDASARDRAPRPPIDEPTAPDADQHSERSVADAPVEAPAQAPASAGPGARPHR